MAGTASDHEEIRDAVIRRDKAMAVTLIKEHITAIGDVILEQYDERE
jgi:DNA-binding GntR family transcriptional regulator